MRRSRVLLTMLAPRPAPSEGGEEYFIDEPAPVDDQFWAGGPANWQAEFVITLPGNGGSQLFFRTIQVTNNNAYAVRFAANGTIQLGLWTDGMLTSLASQTNACQSGDAITVTLQGSSIRIFVNGVEQPSLSLDTIDQHISNTGFRWSYAEGGSASNFRVKELPEA